MLKRPRVSFAAPYGCLVIMFCFFGLTHPAGAEFSPGYAGFEAQCNGQNLAYQIQSVFVLPGERLHLEVVDQERRMDYGLDAKGCSVTSLHPGAWQALAPSKPGVYPALLADLATGRTIRLQIIVLVPFRRLQNQVINGYRIGAYPVSKSPGGAYGQPPGFIEVTAANQAEWVSPHFKLQQFRCKQTGGFPQYIVLRPELLSKLEKILERLSARGCALQTLNILSGYRTPYYNQLIHNKYFSAHQWGLAADIRLEDMSEDLNHDGRLDLEDVEILYQTVDDLEAEPAHASLAGGIGLYLRTAQRGPFLHVDVRGFRARWGALPLARQRFAHRSLSPAAESAAAPKASAGNSALP